MRLKVSVFVLLGVLALAGCSGKGEESNAKAPVAAPTVVAPSSAGMSYDATLSEGVQLGAKPGYPKFIKSVSGVSGYEPPNGCWTDGKTAVFTFVSPLPNSFKLHLEVSGVFGPNLGKPVEVTVGDWKGEFTDKNPGPQSFDLDVKTSQPAESITLTIPEPTSPKELKMSADPRLLGIFLKKLSIEEVSNAQE